MEYPGDSKILPLTKEQFEAVRKYYNVTEKSINIAIDNLIEWYKEQPHLPKVELDRNWVERIYIFHKCTMEGAKNGLDMAFSAKSLFPDFFAQWNPKNAFYICKNRAMGIYVPTLAPDLKRITILKLHNQNVELLDHLEYQRLMFMFLEYRLRHDYCLGGRFVIDIRGLTMNHITKFRFDVMKREEVLFEKVFGHCATAIHFICSNPLFEKFIYVLKMAMSDNLKNRFHVHHDLEGFYKFAPKETLPRDYGGEAESSDEIFANWEKEICGKENLEWIEKMEKTRSDESKRKGEAITDEKLGIPPPKRLLEID